MMIEEIPEMQLSAQDDQAIAGLLARCFSSDFGGRSYFTHRHHLRVVYREQGAIIGHMALLLRVVSLNERALTVAGLAEVATDPDHRGKGIAAALLQAAIAAARLSLAEHFLLFGVAKLYEAAGFRPVSNPIKHVAGEAMRLGRTVTTTGNDLMVLPLKVQAWPDQALLDLRGPVF